MIRPICTYRVYAYEVLTIYHNSKLCAILGCVLIQNGMSTNSKPYKLVVFEETDFQNNAHKHYFAFI